MGTRRSLDSPCVGPGAHGEVSSRHVFSSRRTAKVLFTLCPRKSTRQTLRHTANSWFPVVEAFCTSSCRKLHPQDTAIDNMILIVVVLTTGLMVSS